MRRLLTLSAVFFCCAFLLHGGGGGNAGGNSLALVRTINNPTASNTGSQTFWMIGQPFAAGELATSAEVPMVNAVSAKLGSTALRAGFCQRKLDAANNVSWSQVLLDLSPQSITAGGSANLTFTSAPGSWTYDSGGVATDADWQGLTDTVKVIVASTTSTGGADMTGTFTASFNSSASIVVMCNNALGREVRVQAPLVNGSSQNHCYLNAVMYYWVTQNGSGQHGVANSPIASLGPFIQNEQVFKSTCTVSGANAPGVFVYDAAFLRNGTIIRGCTTCAGAGNAYTSVNHPAFTETWLGRPDGQWDWDNNGTTNGTSDPGLYVTQDYTALNGTYKLPAIVHGISYTGTKFSVSGANPAITAINTSTGVFTTTNMSGSLFNTTAPQPQAIEFSGSLGGISSGVALNTVYWAHMLTSTTFNIYDNEINAFTAGSTGKLTGFGGSYSSGMVVQIDAAPESMGVYQANTPGPGARGEIALFQEWGIGYALAGTSTTPQAWQRFARVMSISLDSYPMLIEASSGAGTQTIPSFYTSSASKPNIVGGTGLTVQTTTSSTGFVFSSDINGGAGPTHGTVFTPSGVTGLWSPGSSHSPGSVGYVVWLLEGNPYLQELGVKFAEGDLLQVYEPNRNWQDATFDGGVQFTAVCWSNIGGDGVRGFAWCQRAITTGAMMSPPGTAEEAYFLSAMTQTASWVQAYQSYVDGGVVGNWTKLGIPVSEDGGPPLSSATSLGIYGSNFMTTYGVLSTNWSAMLFGDQVSGLNTIANRVPGLLLMEFNQNCPAFADTYNVDFSLNNLNGPIPGTYVSGASELGVGTSGSGAYLTFSFSGTTVTASAAGIFPFGGSTLGTIPFHINDIYRSSNTDSNGSGGSPINSGTTAGLTDNHDYFLVAPVSGATFSLATTLGGSAISFTTASNVGGITVPAGYTCGANSGDSIGSTMNNPDSYWAYERGALAMAGERGVTGPGAQGTALAAFNVANTRMGGNVPTIFNAESSWAFQATP